MRRDLIVFVLCLIVITYVLCLHHYLAELRLPRFSQVTSEQMVPVRIDLFTGETWLYDDTKKDWKQYLPPVPTRH